MKNKKLILCCKRPDNVQDSCVDSSIHESGMCFVNPEKKISAKKSVVMPFSMVTDGEGIVGLVNEAGSVDIGFATAVTKKKFLGPFTKSGFEDLIVDQIAKSFMVMYEGSQVREDDGFRNMTRSDFHVIKTSFAVCSIDSTQIFPLYFIHLNPESSFRLPATTRDVAVLHLSKEILCDPTVFIRMPMVSKQCATLVGANYLSLPRTDRKRGFR